MSHNLEALKVSQLSFARGNQKIIDNCDWSVTKGGAYALVGESGSGKSTLLLLIAGLLKGTKGSIEVFGVDVGKLSHTERAKEVGMVFQDYQLFPHQTVLENLCLAPKLAGMADVEENAQKLLFDLNIEKLSSRYPFELSGGQKQRVAIARSLMMSPKLLVLDEPSSALDVQSSKDLAVLLDKLSDRTQVIVVSHDLPFIEFFCKRISTMKAGKVISGNEK